MRTAAATLRPLQYDLVNLPLAHQLDGRPRELEAEAAFLLLLLSSPAY